MPETTELAVLKEISEKLDRLLAVTAIAGKNAGEHADVLIKIGLGPDIISSITGLTKNAVAVRKTRLNKVPLVGKRAAKRG